MISLDTEDTGSDLRHGAKPFFVTTCDEDGTQQWWQWEVDPLTREPIIPPGDITEIQHILTSTAAWENGFSEDIQERHVLIGQNIRFDATAISQIGVCTLESFPWSMVRDTLIAGHLLASNRPHNLTDMAVQYLGVNIQPFEDRLEEACNKARNYCRRHLPHWMIASRDLPCMPSAKEKVWKYDMWLPRALIKHWWETSECYQTIMDLSDTKDEDDIDWKYVLTLNGWEFHSPEYNDDNVHPWWTLLTEYSNTDSSVTMALWQTQYKEIHRRSLWAIFKERLKVLPVACEMEEQGVTINKQRIDTIKDDYGRRSEVLGNICCNIARGSPYHYDLTLPKGGSNNNSLLAFCFDKDKLNLPVVEYTDAGKPSLSKDTLAVYMNTLPLRSKQLAFVEALSAKKLMDKTIGDLNGYERYMQPLSSKPEESDWCILHPSLNPTGATTLRWSHSNPNEANIKKSGVDDKDKHTVRYCFGPAPGREWWSLDAKNIELRIPAYESGEEAFIALFERPDDPPYFGSNHLLVAHIIHKKLFEECLSCNTCKKEVWVTASTTSKEKCCQCQLKSTLVDGRVFKKRYATTWYQWTKNGNFAVLYGAVDREDGEGTADRAYRIKGAQAMIKQRLSRLTALNDGQIAYAEKYGYVETIPDRTVDPKRGYPLLCSRTEYGKVKPTVPLNYHVQSTAMQWTNKAMLRCSDQLRQWRKEGFDAYLILQVHDEMVFEMPKSKVHPKEDKGQDSNLWRVKILQKLMEQGGDDIGIKTPVGIELNEHNWSEKLELS